MTVSLSTLGAPCPFPTLKSRPNPSSEAWSSPSHSLCWDGCCPGCLGQDQGLRLWGRPQGELGEVGPNSKGAGSEATSLQVVFLGLFGGQRLQLLSKGQAGTLQRQPVGRQRGLIRNPGGPEAKGPH